MLYLLERRNTAGSFKTLTASRDLNLITTRFNDAVAEWDGYNNTRKIELTNAEKKKYPDVIKYFKIGGSHANVTLRIRQVEEE